MEQKILEYLKRHEVEIIKDLKGLVESQASTSDIAELDVCRKTLERLIRERAEITPFVYKTEGGHDVVRFEYGDGPETILLVGHYDTVHPAGTMECREEGNKLLGPGVYDMKSGLISTIWIIKAYKELGIVPDKKLVILCNGDEETGSRESTEIICREAKLAKAALVVEPCCDNGDLKTGRKGFIQFQVTIRGKAAHSGNAHQDGANAIEEMAHEILFSQGLTDYEVGTTVNVGVAGGGTKCNVVPDQAAFWIECRFKTVSQQQKVIDAICNLEVKVEGTSRQVEVLDNRMPMEEKEGNLKLFEIARRCGEKIRLSFSRQFVGGFSDGNAISAMGIPVLDGLGAVGGHAHSPEEYILIDQFIPRIALLAMLVLNI